MPGDVGTLVDLEDDRAIVEFVDERTGVTLDLVSCSADMLRLVQAQ